MFQTSQSQGNCNPFPKSSWKTSSRYDFKMGDGGRDRERTRVVLQKDFEGTGKDSMGTKNRLEGYSEGDLKVRVGG